MARLAASLLLTLALFMVPTLCMGGFLEHACECSEQDDHQCHHEDSCESDPCSANLALPRNQDVLAAVDIAWPWVPLNLLTWDLGGCPEGQRHRSVPPLPPDRSNLPFRPSDVPLRI